MPSREVVGRRYACTAGDRDVKYSMMVDVSHQRVCEMTTIGNYGIVAAQRRIKLLPTCVLFLPCVAHRLTLKLKLIIQPDQKIRFAVAQKKLRVLRQLQVRYLF